MPHHLQCCRIYNYNILIDGQLLRHSQATFIKYNWRQNAGLTSGVLQITSLQQSTQAQLVTAE